VLSAIVRIADISVCEVLKSVSFEPCPIFTHIYLCKLLDGIGFLKFQLPTDLAGFYDYICSLLGNKFSQQAQISQLILLVVYIQPHNIAVIANAVLF